MRKLHAPAKADLPELLRRDHTLYGGIVVGIDGYIVRLEARALKTFSKPVPWSGAVRVTGMARGAIGEALDRISGAFAKYEIPDPCVEITVNLAPADVPKEGAWLDLPLAIITLQAAGMLPDLSQASESKFILMGEVGLHGEVRRVPGVLSVAANATADQCLVVPDGNEKECSLIAHLPGRDTCKVSKVGNLMEVIDFFLGKGNLKNVISQGLKWEPFISECIDFGRIRGQEKAKTGALIAAAGGHNLLLIGPPGEGKSLLASAIPGILPGLNREEMVELTRIYSACGILNGDGLAITRRPMRKVHPTTSKEALVGGGKSIPRPGEITLAHLGLLFLDEFAEFSRATLDSLRQPIESGSIQLSRTGASLEFPSRFTLVAAMNPCPCGFHGFEDDHNRCSCTSKSVSNYQTKISGPILDRIDLKVEMTRLSLDERFSGSDSNQTPEFRKRVEIARKRQDKRFSGTKIPFNAAIPGGHVKDYCDFSDTGWQAYRQVIEMSHLSTRSMDRLARVSRTIADLYNSDHVQSEHVERAKGYVTGSVLSGVKN